MDLIKNIIDYEFNSTLLWRHILWKISVTKVLAKPTKPNMF